MPHMRREGTVFILDLGQVGEPDTENRFTPQWFTEANTCLDEVDASSGAAALVTTGSGKFYSNGFVPERFAGEPAAVRAYLLAGQAFFARILAAEFPTAAALQGHVFAGGAILAAAHDRRVMRADRGFFCLPEITMGLPIPGAMSDLLDACLPQPAAREAMLTGRRYGGEAAAAAGLVDVAVTAEQVLPEAIAWADATAHTRGPVLAAMKRRLHRGVLDELTRVEL